MKKRGFGSRLLRKYRLTIHNENKLKNVLGFYISPLWVIISLALSFLLVAGILYLVVVFTPVGKQFLSKQAIENTNGENISNDLIGCNLRVDSLLHEVKKQELYLSNIRAIINDEITIDSLESTFISMSQDSIDIESSELEIQFVKEWEEREKYNLTSQAASVAALQELNLFRPTKGEIIRRFDPADGHFGVDIDEIAGENIVSIHDGVVVFSDFSANDGFTIVIQHRENLISIYRNCYRLLKQVGDKVYGGEIIGTLSDGSGEGRKDKKYLHLELWHRSKPIDPNIYIAF